VIVRHLLDRHSSLSSEKSIVLLGCGVGGKYDLKQVGTSGQVFRGKRKTSIGDLQKKRGDMWERGEDVLFLGHTRSKLRDGAGVKVREERGINKCNGHFDR